jgi:periplasmic copper chaperone A
MMQQGRITRIGAIAAVLAIWPISGMVAAQDAKPAAKQQPANVTIVSPWARATPGGAKVGAAFLEIQANPGLEDKLVSAASGIAATVELHDHVREGAVMRMRKVDGIPIPAGKSVTLKPGGLHIMLIDLKEPLVEGGTIELTLTFEKSGAVGVKVPVQKVGAMGNAGSGSGSEHGSGSGSGSGASGSGSGR